MSFFEIQQVHKAYGDVQAVRGVSIAAGEGEFVVLVGPSGCGKSTLLRMIAGLEDITAGDIRIAGKVVNDIEPKHRQIAMVFQNYALYPHMTVAKNMAFSLRFRKTPKAEIAARVAEAAKILGLGDYLERYPRQLSGGQRQRVAMGRAIVRQPRIYLFDEPLSNLDAKLRVQMRAELKALHGRLKTTTIYVTHDQVEAMTMADQIVVMNDGEIAQVGKPLDVYDRPANLFVAGFIGSPAMNLLAGSNRGSDREVSLANGKRLRHGVAGLADGPVVVGVRPEHVVVHGKAGGAKPGGDTLSGRIVTLEPTGLDTLVVAELDGSGAQPKGSSSGKNGLAGQMLAASSRERIDAQVGDVATFSVAAPNVHLFDAKTSLRLGS